MVTRSCTLPVQAENVRLATPRQSKSMKHYGAVINTVRAGKSLKPVLAPRTSPARRRNTVATASRTQYEKLAETPVRILAKHDANQQDI